MSSEPVSASRLTLAPGIRPIGTSKEAMEPLSAYGYAQYRASDQKERMSAALGSERLRDRCRDLFIHFEREHHLPEGFGQKFQLGGYRA